MDPLRKVVSSFLMDVNDYLSFVEDYGKPNYKYFNYVLNRQGLLYIFVSKIEIFHRSSIAARFIEKVFIGLKNRFLSENPESILKRSAIIFLFCKIYFTDDLANLTRLRINCDEWTSFKDFIDTIKKIEAYKSIQIMFYHLYTENFFKFTLKIQSLAMDYGTPRNEGAIQIDSNQDSFFWDGIRSDIRNLEMTDVVDLVNLNSLREEATEPFNDLLPERGILSEALNEFDTLKQLAQKPTESAPTRISRKQASESCRDFLRTSGVGSSTHQMLLDASYDGDDDFELSISVSEKLKSKRHKESKRSKTGKNQDPDSSSSSSDNEKEYKRMNRSLGFQSQSVMRAIGASTQISEKLKKCYGEIE